VLRTCLPHILEGVGVQEKMNALIEVSATIAALMDATCDFVAWDSTVSAANRRPCVERLQVQHIICLARAESVFPETEFPIFLHETIHLCETIVYWNNTRNYWCFITERFVGYVKGFVKNRRFPVANVVICTRVVHIMLA
jgi:hypothetical protein